MLFKVNSKAPTLLNIKPFVKNKTDEAFFFFKDNHSPLFNLKEAGT